VPFDPLKMVAESGGFLGNFTLNLPFERRFVLFPRERKGAYICQEESYVAHHRREG
jgi:hypothetical protein